MRRFALCLAMLVAGLLAPAAFAQDIFRLGNGRVDRVVVTDGREPPKAEAGTSSPMLDRLDGVLAREDGRLAVRLRSLTQAAPRRAEPGDAIFAVYFYAEDESRRLEISRDDEGRWLITDPLHRRAPVGVLQANLFVPMAASWSTYRGPLVVPPATATEDGQPARVFAIEQPYVPGWHFLDEQLTRQRLIRSGSVRVKPPERVLSRQRLIVRMPANFTPMHPPGILVWIDPTAAGTPPAMLQEALDALNLIAVGAVNHGNDVFAIDRLQLALDGIATVATRFHVDPERIYVTGLSGGGRLTSWMWAGFPDIVAGGVPIVGLDGYRIVSGRARKRYQPSFDRPTGEQLAKLRERRLAPITGPGDFNYDPVTAFVEDLQKDGLQVRLFDVPGLGHELPNPAQFLEALRWVDEPVQAKASQARAEASIALKKAIDTFGAGSPVTAEHREALVEVTRLGPWTDAAWDAVRLVRPELKVPVREEP